MSGKIIALAGAFDAMTSDRSYCKRLTYDEALKRIENASGSQFDPKIVDIFVRLFKKGGWGQMPLSFPPLTE